MDWFGDETRGEYPVPPPPEEVAIISGLPYYVVGYPVADGIGNMRYWGGEVVGST